MLVYRNGILSEELPLLQKMADSHNLYSAQQSTRHPILNTLASCVLGRSAVEQPIEEVLAVSDVYCACCMQLTTAPIDDTDLSGCEN